MAYPRRCPLCNTDYQTDGPSDLAHVTLAAEPGGTPSPWRPELPGRLLTLRCRACGGRYRWDYFADSRQQLLEQLRLQATDGLFRRRRRRALVGCGGE